MTIRRKVLLYGSLIGAIALVSAQTVQDHRQSQVTPSTKTPANKPPAHHRTEAMTANQLPLTVDGSQTPQLIPDDLAYRHFILSVAEHTSPTPDDVKRRASRLRLIGISQADQNALIAALSGVREQLDAIDASRASTPPTNSAALQQLLIQQTSILNNAQTAILSSVSAQGTTQLEAYIQNFVKKGIKIYASN